MADPIIVDVKLGNEQIKRDLDQIKRQLESVRDENQRRSEEKERAHLRRIEALRQQSAASLQQIEARKQAQIDVIRERAVQREIEQQRRIERAAQTGGGAFQTFLRRFSSTIREAGESIQQAGFAALGLTNLITGLARASIQSAIDIDKQVNVLRSLTGSAEAAEKRFAALVAVARQTPGLTTSLATTLDAQLRVASVTEQTINKILPAVGKLNAISPLADPQRFAQNLIQLITQNFEKIDLKELVGQSPLAGEIIKSIFNVDSPINGKAIREAAKKLGIDTTDEFFTAFAQAAANNPKLANVQESLGTQIEKLRDRVLVAIRPLGLELLEIITPAVERIVPVIEQVFSAFARLPEGLQTAIIAFGALAAAIGPAVIALGGIIQFAGAIGNLITVFTGFQAATAGTTIGLAGLSLAFKPVLIALAATTAAVGLAIGAYKLYTLATEDNTEVVRQNAAASNAQTEEDRKQVEQLQKLTDTNKINKQDQEQIRKLYDQLNPVQQERVKLYAEEAGGVETLSGKLAGLIELLKQENALRAQRARTEALDAGGDVVAGALRNSANQSVVANNVANLSAEFNRLTQAIAKAENENQVFFGGLNLRRFRVADSLKVQLNQVEKDLSGAIGRQRALQAEAQGSANAIRQLAQSAQLSPETFAAQFVGGDVDKLDRVLDVLRSTSSFIPETAPKPAAAPGRTGGGGSGQSVSAQQALRQAQLRAEQDAQRNAFSLLQDQNERILRENERFFEIGLIQTEQFFSDKLGIQQASIGNEINLLNQQLIAAQDTFDQTKPGTAERVRIQQQLNDLQTQIILKTRELGDVEQAVSRESLTAKNQAVEAAKQQIELADEQGKKEKELLAAVKERAQTQEAIVRSARQALTDRGKELDREVLQAGENLDLKILNAQKEAILENKRADEDATLSIIRNRERLADASVFHANRANAIFLEHLARQKSVTEAVADAQIRAFEGVAGSLDRGIDRLTTKLGFFGEAINGILKAVVRNIVTQLFAPTFGGGGGQQGGGLLGSILGGIFGPAGGGLASGTFRTPSTFPGNSFNFGSLLGLSGGGSNLVAPPSTSSQIPGVLEAIAGGGSGGGAARTGFGALFGNLGNLFKGFGFGRNPGSATGGLAAAAPLLGLTLGAGLGGQSTLGKILGGAGGVLAGIGLTAAPAGLAGASPLLAGLFSNPITAIVGAGLLVGSIFLGKASQRRKDEEASGQMLTQALNAIQDLKVALASDQIEGSQARGIFDTQILGQFRAGIGTLKTESVRTSRLTNQVRDLENVYQAVITPEIAAQERRGADRRRFAAIDSRLIPQFASGGLVPGVDLGRDSVLSLLRPGEMVLTRGQQAAVMMQSNAGVFERAGVPHTAMQAGPAQAFQFGGIAQLASGASSGGTIVIDRLFISIDSESIAIAGMSGRNGEQVIINHIENVNLRKGRR